MDNNLNDDLLHLVDNVERWATERNLIGGATVGAQFLKLVEEAGEQSAELSRDITDVDALLSETGDAIVVAIIMSAQMKQSLGPSLLCASNPNNDDDRPEEGPDAPLYPYPETETPLEVLGRLAESIAKRYRPGFFHALHSFVCVTLTEAIDTLDERGFYYSSALPNRTAVAHVSLSLAWDKIKDRKGRMIDGVFVKEADL